METGTITALGGVLGSAKLVEKILGPSAEYIGEQLKSWTQKKVENLSNIFTNAENKLGDRINEEGSVSPKVLKEVLDEGAWCEERLQTEYFGGVLASSRTGISRDDRGAYFAKLISRLSSYQLRLHYMIYHNIRHLFLGKEFNVGLPEERRKMEIYVSITSYFQSMDFEKEEIDNWNSILIHSIWGLDKDNLISTFSYGGVDHLKDKYSDVKEYGFIIQPSQLGIELYLWAYGLGISSCETIFKPSVKIDPIENIQIGKAISTKNND